jgi:hypothetical protein
MRLSADNKVVRESVYCDEANNEQLTVGEKAKEADE